MREEGVEGEVPLLCGWKVGIGVEVVDVGM